MPEASGQTTPAGAPAEPESRRADPRLPAWLSLLHLAETPSTNALLRVLLQQGPAGGADTGHALLLHAAYQSAGRGSRGRAWLQGGPGLDIALTLGIDSSRVCEGCRLLLSDPRLTLLAASVCASALEKASGLPISVKWPNDLLCGDPPAKTGGILCESFSGWTVIGVGVNVNSSVQHFPGELGSLTTLSDCAGRQFKLYDLLVALAAELALTFAQPQGEAGPAVTADELLADYVARDRSGGKRYRLLRGAGIEVEARCVQPHSGELLCVDAAGNEYSVLSYTELENV